MIIPQMKVQQAQLDWDRLREKVNNTPAYLRNKQRYAASLGISYPTLMRFMKGGDLAAKTLVKLLYTIDLQDQPISSLTRAQ